MLNNIFFPIFLKKILLPVNVFGSKQIIISKSTPGIRLLDIGKKRPRNVFLCFNIINILSSLPYYINELLIPRWWFSMIKKNVQLFLWAHNDTHIDLNQRPGTIYLIIPPNKSYSSIRINVFSLPRTMSLDRYF